MKDNNLIGIVMWIVGILVSLAVGSGMIDEVLTIPLVLPAITIAAGWVVVVGAIVSLVMAIFNK